MLLIMVKQFSTEESGFNMVKELKLELARIHTQDHGSKAKEMDMEPVTTLMGINTLESSKRESSTAMVSKHGLMEESTMEHGKTRNSTALVT